MLGVLAECRRSLIQARVNAGLARARAKGVLLVQPRIAPKVEQRIRERAAQGIGKQTTARTGSVGVSVV